MSAALSLAETQASCVEYVNAATYYSQHVAPQQIAGESCAQSCVGSDEPELQDAVALRVVEVLSGRVYVGRSEMQIQDRVAEVLQNAGLVVEREYRLSQRDRPDFLVDNHVVVEVKRKTPRSAVLRQLGRYAEHEQVTAIVLASTSFTTLRNMRLTIHGVEVYPAILRGSGIPT